MKIRYLYSTLVKPRLELTLAILKPDLSSNPLAVECVRDIILKNGFYFIKTKHVKLNKDQASEFYKEHKGKFFYERLVSFMASGPINLHILSKENAIYDWRQLMGPTKVYKAQHEAPESLRAKFGLTDTRNACHGSDSSVTALREIEFFFEDFDVNNWYNKEELIFRNGSEIVFNPDKLEHEILERKLRAFY